MKLYSLLLLLFLFNISAFAQSPDVFMKDSASCILPIEISPEFPGGEVELKKYLKKNLKYPKSAMESGIEGRVYASFTITVDGKIENIKIRKGLGRDFDNEAIRLIRNMPSWKPGKQEGRTVPVNYSLPVFFESVL